MDVKPSSPRYRRVSQPNTICNILKRYSTPIRAVGNPMKLEYERNGTIGSQLEHPRSMPQLKPIQPPLPPFLSKPTLQSSPHPPPQPPLFKQIPPTFPQPHLQLYPHKLNHQYQPFPSLFLFLFLNPCYLLLLLQLLLTGRTMLLHSQLYP